MKKTAEIPLHILQKDDFPAIYKIIEQSFPPDEYRPFEESLALLSHPSYSISVTYNDLDRGGLPTSENGLTVAPESGGNCSAISGFIAAWSFPEFYFIEHFAVNPTARNAGLGSRLLTSWTKNCLGDICLEVEPPLTPMARRRIDFYKRNGFHLNRYPYEQPPISEGKRPIPLLLMSWGRPLSAKEFSLVRDTLYREVYKV